MKILIVSRGYPTQEYKTNGIFEFDQAKALVETGIDVVYAVVDVRSIRRWRKWGHESFIKEGVQIEAINIPIGAIPKNMQNKFKQNALNHLYKKIVNKHGKPDIIHSHFINMGYISANSFKNSGIPLVHTEHYSGMNKEKLSEYYQYLGDNTYRYMDKVISVSKALGDNLKNKFQIEPVVIPNIVDTTNFNYKPLTKSNDEFNFISVGSLTRNKRMDLLINSFYDAFKDKSNIKLYIYGKGPERKTLENIIDNLDLKNQVFLMGFIARQIISRKMNESHCFVLASRSETFGVAYIEAMASGLPVIATRCGGPEDFVNEENGILVPVDDKEKLTLALEDMYRNSSRYNRENLANKTKEKFGSHNIGQSIIKEYNKILV